MATGLTKTKWNGAITDLQGLMNGQSTNNSTGFNPVWIGNPKSANKLFWGDNYYVLKHLLNDEDIVGNVKLVYIDPPYSTNSIFQTRNLENAYTDLITGEGYIEFMRARLLILKKLLSDDGSIYVHLDKNMVFQIKVLMDEIFGSNNFRNLITRKKCKTKNFTRNSFGNISDYILFYTKGKNYTWNKPYEEWTDSKVSKEFTCIEEGTGRRYKKVPIHAPGVRNGETGKPWKEMMPPKGKHWQYTPDKLEAMDQRGEIYWSRNGNPRKKVYLDASKGIAMQDIWLNFIDSNNQNDHITGYPTEKNFDMMKRIIQTSSNQGDLVLDCFAGSGTTLSAASELERKWIGVDCEEKAVETILKRFFNGTQKMGDYVKKKNGMQAKLSLFEDSKKEEPKSKIHVPVKNFTIFTEENLSNHAQEMVERELRAQ